MSHDLLNLDLVVELVHEVGIWADVEQTGGGCATIYAGARYLDQSGDLRYAAVAGPGTFGWGRVPSTAATSEFWISADDNGLSRPLDAPELGIRCEHDVAALIVAQARMPLGATLPSGQAEQILRGQYAGSWTRIVRVA
jgi:hypothetical protein